MATSLAWNGGSEFVIGLINSTELSKLFFDLEDKLQMEVLNTAFKQSAKIITDAAKSNFSTTKKGLSKTGYTAIATGFTSRPLKNDIGVVFGLKHKDGYKYLFLNYGTKARLTKQRTPRKRGAIIGSLFFTNAVRNNSEAAYNSLSNGIIETLEKIVNSHGNN